MRYTLIILLCCLLVSCSDAFINHDLTFEKAGECSDVPKPVNMTSNINGERYEFLSCMDESFNGKNYTVTRKGDSILVGFPRTAGKKKLLYKLVLDIDAKPAYHHIILDENDITVIPAQR